MANPHNIKRGLVGIIVLAIFALTFLIVKPLIIPIILGLLFSYIFRPVYKKIYKAVRNKSLAASLLVVGLIAVIALPVIYFLELIVVQGVEAYVSVQNLNLTEILSNFIDSEIVSVIAINLDNIIGAAFSLFLTQLKDILVNLPSLLFQFVVFLFTFYFATRDAEKFQTYISSLSPFSATTEKKFFKEFRGITNAIIFGQVLIGVIQGLALGAGLFFLGVPNVLILTLVAAMLSMIPVLGSWLVWLPVSVFLLVTDQTFAGVFLILYGGLFVSSIDNLLRPYILSKQSTLPVALSLIGTVGGLLFFGIVGLVLGPLIIAYALIIVELYRRGKLKDLFIK
jgi:predicted PurR-regulated permease PerM